MAPHMQHPRISASPELRAATLTALGQWVAAIADRVRNPIAGLVATLDLVEERAQGVDTFVDASLVRMRERLLSLNSYVSELIDFTQPPRLHLTRVDVGSVVSETLAALRARTPAKSRIELRIPDATCITADRCALVRIVAALYENSLQAVPVTREPQVAISAELERGRGGLLLIVDDNGPGFPPDYDGRVLEPFFTTKEAGTGLGLSIVRKLVEAHCGTVRVARSPHLGGARVEVFLPEPTLPRA